MAPAVVLAGERPLPPGAYSPVRESEGPAEPEEASAARADGGRAGWRWAGE